MYIERMHTNCSELAARVLYGGASVPRQIAHYVNAPYRYTVSPKPNQVLRKKSLFFISEDRLHVNRIIGVPLIVPYVYGKPKARKSYVRSVA